MSDRPRILAVVVTFNRLGLLRRLVDRLLEVPELAEILVIDNCSIDGTGAWLAGHPGVRHLVLPENRGGAGGFSAGVSWAVERGADLIWLMDDDGLPDPGCLPELLQHRDDFDFYGPVVVDEAAPDRLVFPIRVPGRSTVLHRVAQVEQASDEGVLPGVVIPFNGVLVTADLVRRIGPVREDFFIWGDDHEYRLRAERAGARIATVVAARVRHPRVGELGTPMAFGATTYNHSPSDLKHYCMARNNLVNLLTYRGRLAALAFVLKTLWFYTFTRPAPSRLRLSLAAMRSGLAGDFTGHRRLLPAPGPPVRPRPDRAESVAVVIVTFNRADLLGRVLDGLAAQTRPVDAIYVFDNASVDHTAEVLAARSDLPLKVTHHEENLGGAGGFHRGVALAYGDGHDRIWLMDDDVVPAPDCLETLLTHPDDDCLTAVREDRSGRLVEKAALHFDLRNPLSLRPKRASIDSAYATRAELPERVQVENVAFEGFLVHRRVIDDIGLPDASYFIFYDDVDFAVRARLAGYRIMAIRDAVLVRQLDFDQQHALDSWKGYYMYRNLFVVHFRYGENVWVRLKPYLIAAGVVVLSPTRGGIAEARNVLRAIVSARAMRRRPG